MSAIVRFCRARCCAVRRFGMAMAARIPTMATTTSAAAAIPITSASVFDPPAPAPGRDGAPFVGFPHDAHGTKETWATWLPQYAQLANPRSDRKDRGIVTEGRWSHWE